MSLEFKLEERFSDLGVGLYLNLGISFHEKNENLDSFNFLNNIRIIFNNNNYSLNNLEMDPNLNYFFRLEKKLPYPNNQSLDLINFQKDLESLSKIYN